MNPFTLIMRSHNVWQNTPIALINATERLYNRITMSPYTKSRTLYAAINDSIGYYLYHTNIEPYKVISTMCSLMLNNKPIELIPDYWFIDSYIGETLDLAHCFAHFGHSQNKIRINLCHVPRGKSYLKKVLDTAPLTRLKPIEAFCIEDVNHFVRIYKGFGNSGSEDITVFTDKASAHLIETLYVMLPNLLEIETINTSDCDIIPEEYETHNKKVGYIRELFTLLFTHYQNKILPTEPELNTVIKPKITQILTDFTNLFDFATAQIDTFTKRLAKAKNDSAQKHYTEKLDNITRRIQNLENDLNTAYAEQIVYQRELNANKTINEEDVQPFIDTIKNSKAIEILHADDTKMTLRITAPLQYFTESDFETYEKNTTSEYNHLFETLPTLKRVLHKVFVTREYKLLAQGIITIKINDNYFSNVISASAQQSSLNNFIEFPNPHLYHYNCWSKAQSEMTKNINAGNFELVVMQMIAAVQTVNIAEHASFVNGLLKDISGKGSINLQHLCHFLDKDNKVYSFVEIIAHEQELYKTESIEKAKESLENTEKKGYSQIVLPDDIDDEDNIVTPPLNNIYEDEDDYEEDEE